MVGESPTPPPNQSPALSLEQPTQQLNNIAQILSLLIQTIKAAGEPGSTPAPDTMRRGRRAPPSLRRETW